MIKVDSDKFHVKEFAGGVKIPQNNIIQIYCNWLISKENEVNQPIRINEEDKPTSTSTPKRKARDEQGAPKKKLQTENIDH